MLKEAMLALRVTDMEYAPEICGYLKSAETDLKMAGVIIQGTCEFVITETTDELDPTAKTVTVTDNSTITDEAVKTAMITYCRMHFGSPADYDRLAASYDLQRRQLANATGYTDFLEEEEQQETEGDPSASPGGSAQDDTQGAAESEGDPSASPGGSAQDDTGGDGQEAET